MYRSFVAGIVFWTAAIGLAQFSTMSAQNRAVTSANLDDNDSVTLRDGLPLRIKATDGYSSSTAKVGDSIIFTVTYPVLVDGIVVIPAGTVVAAKVSSVMTPRGKLRDGQVNIAFDGLTLPSGQAITVRPLLNPLLPKNKIKEAVNTVSGAPGTAIQYSPSFLPLLFIKGEEQVVAPGTIEVVYLNGPLQLSRKAAMNLAPAVGSAIADVFYVNRHGGFHMRLYCGQRLLGDYSYKEGVRLRLKPGIYWLSTGNRNDAIAEVHARENSPSYVERDKGGLFVKDFQSNIDLIYRGLMRKSSDLDLTTLTTEESRTLTGQPDSATKP
jgi:hypothetical protein